MREEEHIMKAIRNAALACAIALAAAPALAQVKIKQGMLNVPALSPLWLLPDEAKKHGIDIEMVMFQRFADARTALASGDIQITAFGPQEPQSASSGGVGSTSAVVTSVPSTTHEPKRRVITIVFLP
jgi:ABC-type nitrate/sulfonate/bicarbonate transport system substrate-binding protein